MFNLTDNVYIYIYILYNLNDTKQTKSKLLEEKINELFAK